MKQPTPDLVVAGKYRLEGQLASGGMGSVWVAHHVDLGIPVAIKFMGPEVAESEEGRMRFEREAKAAARLQSPHVVNVQDYGVDDGLAYIVMELLLGEDLEEKLHREKRLSLDALLTIMAQTAKALRRAQDLGIVHRDIKPHNLYLAMSDDGEETLKVLDFGIAKETGPTLLAKGPNTGQIIGSPHYMSPEAVRGLRDIDHRSDLWSLGVIAFQALTGRLPFASEMVGDVMGMILADPLPRATEFAPDLPPEIDRFFEKALARNRVLRFQSAREMVEAFAEIVGPSSSREPFSSRPPYASYPPPSSHPSPSSRPSPTPAAMVTPAGSAIGSKGPNSAARSNAVGSVSARAALGNAGSESKNGGASSLKKSATDPLTKLPPVVQAVDSASNAESAKGATSSDRSEANRKTVGGAEGAAQAKKAMWRRNLFVGAIGFVAAGAIGLLVIRPSGEPAAGDVDGSSSGRTQGVSEVVSATSVSAASAEPPLASSGAASAEPPSASSGAASAEPPLAGSGAASAEPPLASSGASSAGKPAPSAKAVLGKGAPAPKTTGTKPKRSWGF